MSATVLTFPNGQRLEPQSVTSSTTAEPFDATLRHLARLILERNARHAALFAGRAMPRLHLVASTDPTLPRG